MRVTGKFVEAVEAAERALELDKESALFLTSYAQTLAAAGSREKVAEILIQLEKLSAERFVSSYHTAIIHTFLNDEEQAIAALEKSYRDREAWLVWLGVEPVFDSLRNDARFTDLLKRTGNPLFYRGKTVGMNLSDTSADKIQTTDTDNQSDKKPAVLPAKSQFLKRALIAAGLFIVIIGVAFFAMRFGWRRGSEYNEENSIQKNISKPAAATADTLSIAVLPFATVNAKTEEDEYLGVGTADIVTSKLGQISEINLRSASSVRRYLKTEKAPSEIGRELAADYVVTGTIERLEKTVEAKLQMIQISSGRVVWSEIFNEPNSDLFALQDSISELIVKSLSLRLTNAEQQNLARHFTENDKAQQFYLAGRYHFGKRTLEGLRQAIELFEQAIAVDRNFALAYTGLADCQALLNWYQEPQPPDAWKKAKAAAERAVALDDNLAEAHASLAFIKFHFERDYRGAEDEFRRAVNLKPNYATAHQWYAFMLSAQARHHEAIAVMRHAEDLEPRSAVIASAVANVLFLAKLYDESIAQAKRALEIDASSVGAHVILRWNYEKKNMSAEALATFEKEIAFAGDTPTSRAKRAHVLAAVGRKDEARQILGELDKTNQIEHITPYEIAVIYALLGDKDKSFEYLKKAKNAHAVGFSFARVDPQLDNLRGDKQFENLVK